MKKVPSSYSTPGTPTSNRSPSRMAKSTSSSSSSGISSTNNRLLPGFLYASGLLTFFNLVLVQRNLIDSPTTSLVQTVPFLILVQAGYCIFARLAPGKKNKRGVEEMPAMATQLSSVALATILSMILSALVFVLLILFGAPVTSLLADTFMCAMHISLLSVLPLVYVYNLDSAIWRDIISVKLPLNSVYGAAVGTWLGAWLGAIPIPLDWDRPWQQWPITIVAGAYYGTAIGTLVGGTWANFRKRQKTH